MCDLVPVLVCEHNLWGILHIDAEISSIFKLLRVGYDSLDLAFTPSTSETSGNLIANGNGLPCFVIELTRHGYEWLRKKLGCLPKGHPARHITPWDR